MKESKNFLGSLMMTPSPSGEEQECIKIWDSAMKSLGLRHEYSDKLGNSAWSMGDGKTVILLSAHIDEVSARVQCIGDSGSLSIINTGGIDRKSLVASEVLVKSDSGDWIRGVVEKKALHCESEEEYGSTPKMDALKINLGYQKKEEVEKLGIHPGSSVVYQRKCLLDFGDSLVCGCGLDDKSGIYVLSRIAEHLCELGYKSEKYKIVLAACTQEETGLRGASRLAGNLNPDISIDFDVTFATDGDLGVEKEKYGDVCLGRGGVLEYGPDKSVRLNKILMKCAKEADIPYQVAASRCGGTNTDEIQLRSRDCETTLVSIPNRSMHSPVEVCSWLDLEAIANMVCLAIESEEV